MTMYIYRNFSARLENYEKFLICAFLVFVIKLVARFFLGVCLFKYAEWINKTTKVESFCLLAFLNLV